MKRLTISLLSLALVGLFFLTSCEGPAGPAGANGKDGTNGTNGKDANIICGVCHSAAATDANLKFSQFDYSQHKKGVIYEEEGGRLACGGCHTGEGFVEAATIGKDDPVTMATGPINCRTCHTIHAKFDSTDFGFRITAGFKLRQTQVDVDFKEGNTCAKCHQARAFVRSAGANDTIKAASTGAAYSRFGPHYGVVANVVSGNGLYNVPGSAAYPTSANPHYNLPKGCVSCHMATDKANPAVGGHTFSMPVANLSTLTSCTTCHDAAKMKSAPTTTQIGKDIVTYRSLLIKKGYLDTTQAITAEGGYQVLGEYFATPGGKTQVYDKTTSEVILNYLYIAKERSKGVHNPAWVKAAVANGIEFLSK